MKKRLIAVMMAITLATAGFSGVPVAAAEVTGEEQTTVQEDMAEEAKLREAESEEELKGGISEKDPVEPEMEMDKATPNSSESEGERGETEYTASNETKTEEQIDEAENAESVISETEDESLEAANVEVSDAKETGQGELETEEGLSLFLGNNSKETPVTETEEQPGEIPQFATMEGVTEEIRDSAFNASALMWDVNKILEAPILETDVTSASEGCFMMGLAGEYIASQQAFLDRINEIRKEACEEGVMNPATYKPLTPDDYVPLKWSRGLEEIARIRAAESALTQWHSRTNGSGWSNVKNDCRSSSECIAFSYAGTATYGVEQWYREKSDWTGGNMASAGHYAILINPGLRYVGGGTFCSPYTDFYNTTAAEFSGAWGLDESFVDFSGACIQMLEVAERNLNGDPYIIGTLSGIKGEEQALCVALNVKYTGGIYVTNTQGFLLKDSVEWTSSDETVAAVSDEGVVKAGKSGKATITASVLSGTNVTADFTVNQSSEETSEIEETGENKANSEGAPGINNEEDKKDQTKSSETEHQWNKTYTVDLEATCTEEGSESIHCSVCGAVKEGSSREIPVVKGFWRKNSMGWCYGWSDGTYLKNCIENIGGKTYYFDSNGYMQTGWQKFDGNWYYLGESGAMQTGWIRIGSVWYYTNDEGIMQTGWQKISNKWYYFGSAGNMLTGWQKISNKWYYFHNSGEMVSNKWIGNFYLTASGVMATNTWIGQYYVGSDGKWIPGYKVAK